MRRCRAKSDSTHPPRGPALAPASREYSPAGAGAPQRALDRQRGLLADDALLSQARGDEVQGHDGGGRQRDRTLHALASLPERGRRPAGAALDALLGALLELLEQPLHPRRVLRRDARDPASLAEPLDGELVVRDRILGIRQSEAGDRPHCRARRAVVRRQVPHHVRKHGGDLHEGAQVEGALAVQGPEGLGDSCLLQQRLQALVLHPAVVGLEARLCDPDGGGALADPRVQIPVVVAHGGPRDVSGKDLSLRRREAALHEVTQAGEDLGADDGHEVRAPDAGGAEGIEADEDADLGHVEGGVDGEGVGAHGELAVDPATRPELGPQGVRGFANAGPDRVARADADVGEALLRGGEEEDHAQLRGVRDKLLRHAQEDTDGPAVVICVVRILVPDLVLKLPLVVRPVQVRGHDHVLVAVLRAAHDADHVRDALLAALYLERARDDLLIPSLFAQRLYVQRFQGGHKVVPGNFVAGRACDARVRAAVRGPDQGAQVRQHI
mmetsp:Transcript_95486/g.187470  ORF Transcript_95486/g.187470 Transcript_95486/m.187470 type:complete len:498 (-) Transcript_95486:145-1638(-)